MALTQILQQSGSHAKQSNAVYRPLFFRLVKDTDRQELIRLIESQSQIHVFDALEGQLAELIKCLHPSQKFTADQLAEAVKVHLKGTLMEEYGVWVYYPWSERLVHILDEKEFIELRTSRNLYKITREEREVLAQQKIGVIGLSVGQSVAVTMAMERTFGEIRLADFDTLELTNMNRIRTGIHNLGIPKVVITAREIAEIDPFLKITCFFEGLTETNMDAFFLDGGKLNLLVEECDGVDIKITSRLKARQLGIPVVMEASDRCTLDVERFDLERDRPILHGFIDHLDPSKLKTLKTSEEKIPYMLPIVGLETISSRLKASILEIEQTITTWPQLASAVALGGGLTTDVIRRILLNEFHESGRYHIDVEELIGNRSASNNEGNENTVAITQQKAPLLKEEMEQIVAQALATNSNSGLLMPELQVATLVELAIQAPSAGNNQPWQWFYSSGILFLFQDPSHCYQFGDFFSQSIYTSLGAAIENLTLASQQAGYEVKVSLFPLQAEPKLVASIQFLELNSAMPGIEPPGPAHLFPYISARYTGRQSEERRLISSSQLEAIQEAAKVAPGVSLELVHDPVLMHTLGEIIAGAERIRLLHLEGHQEVFTKEIRWNRAQVDETRDGIDLATFNLTPSEEAGFRVAKDPQVIELLNQWKGGKGFEKLGRKAVASASALGLITIPAFAPEHFLIGGRALQRVWLTATQLRLTLQPLTTPIYLFAQLIQGDGKQFSPKATEELYQWRAQFEQIFPVLEQQTDLLLFRLSITEQLPVRSLRRYVHQVLHFDSQYKSK